MVCAKKCETEGFKIQKCLATRLGYDLDPSGSGPSAQLVQINMRIHLSFQLRHIADQVAMHVPYVALCDSWTRQLFLYLSKHSPFYSSPVYFALFCSTRS
jgi:hypothetical protein